MTLRPNQLRAFFWQGRALLTTGLALFSGRAGDNRLHRHYAVQLALSESGKVRLTDADGRQHVGGFVGCAAGTMHRIEATEDEIVLVYLEPTSTLGAAVQTKLDSISIIDSQPQPALVRALRQAIADAAPVAAANLLHPIFCGGKLASEHRLDLRLAVLIDSAAFHAVPPSLVQAAQQIAVSPSRFSHLFSAEMGIAYRAFRKWRKLLATLESVANGAKLTAAAHDGGFADSAHFSRTFKDTFGLTPTEALFRVKLSPPLPNVEAR